MIVVKACYIRNQTDRVGRSVPIFLDPSLCSISYGTLIGASLGMGNNTNIVGYMELGVTTGS